MKPANSAPQSSVPPASWQAENEELRARLREAEETIEAIRSGSVDALVVAEAEGNRIYTLQGADRPYRLFVEEMDQGAATLHPDGTIAWCNRRLALLLKIAPEKLIGSALRNYVAPPHHVIYDNLLWQGQTRSGRSEAQLQRTDGGLVPAFLTFNALPPDCGSAIGVLVTDLTPQRHHEQLTAAHAALRESQRQLALVADTVPIFIAHCDTEGRFKFVNGPYARRFGLTPGACVGKRLDEVLGADAFQSIRPYVDQVLAGRALEFELEIPYPLLGRHFMHCSYVPEREPGGRVIGFVAAISDITERRKMEENLRASKERYQLATRATRDVVWDWNRVSDEVVWSEALHTYYGHAPEGAGSVISHAVDWWTDHIHPEDRPRVSATFREASAARREEWTEEYRFRRADGTYAHVADSAFIVFGADGQPLRMVGAMSDISERKQAEEQLRRNHDTFFNLIENAPFGVYVVDAQFRMKQVSAGSRKVFSTVRPLLGRDFAEVLHTIWPEPFANEVKRRFRHTLETGEAYVASSLTEQRRDIPAVESYDWKIERVSLPDGQFGVVCYFYDITERQQAQEALRLAQAQLAGRAAQLEQAVTERTAELTATNEQLEAFVYSIAHDLRAPLRAMQGFSELLVQEAGSGLSAKGQDFAGRISRSAQFMDALLQDLLAFSRIAQQQMELMAVPLEAIVQSVVARLENEIEGRSGQVILAGPWPAVWAHEATLGQVLTNLISNALKFTAAGVSPVVRVRVEAAKRSSDPNDAAEPWVRVWVEDNGLGIAPEHREKVFRLFTRLHGQAFGGTGVGLAIVQKGVDRLGGRLGVESTPGKGSRFWFELREATAPHKQSPTIL